MDCKSLLKEFMTTFGPSGYEKEVAYLLKQKMTPFTDEIYIDRMGNVISRIDGTDEKAPIIMIFAHMDQIGFIVRKVESDGFLRVDRLGGIQEKVLPGLNVRIRTKDGCYVNGVFGSKSHHASLAEDQNKVDPLGSLLIDIGAASEEDVRSMGIGIGCPAVFAPNFQELAGDFISGTAVDNRGGLTALVGAAKLMHQKRPQATVYLVGTIWEEFNCRGAVFATRAIKPDITIALDVVLSGDTKDLSAVYDTKCGNGPALEYYSFHGRGTLNGTLAHEGLAKLTEKAASEDNLALQYFASLGILTDSAYVQLEGHGSAAIELGYPVRYTHTPVETVNTKDLEDLAQLLYSLTSRINRDFNLNRY